MTFMFFLLLSSNDFAMTLI